MEIHDDASPILQFKSVTKTFDMESGTFTALSELSFSLPKGAFAAVTGPSGSGKSTLLNIASGLDRPTQGEVFIAGKSIVHLSQSELCRFRRQNLGFVFQSYNLFPVLTALENVEFTARIRGDSPKLSRERAVRALKLVGLEDKLNSVVTKLSGGQQQRVAVARALTTNPNIVFADEPTANLDSKTASQLIELFEHLNDQLKVTFLFSTHDLKLVDRVKMRFPMQDGRLVQ